MTVTNAAAGVAVTDLRVSKDWYQKLFGRAPDTDLMEELFQWALPTGDWRLFASKSLAGSSSITLVEDDLSKRLTQIFAPQGTTSRNWSTQSASRSLLLRMPTAMVAFVQRQV
jgi:hypothetical protein